VAENTSVRVPRPEPIVTASDKSSRGEGAVWYPDEPLVH
jgi:hypothetical protein